MPPRRRSNAAVALTPSDLQALVNGRWPGAMKFADDPEFEITRMPTGLLALDTLLAGGFARGRHSELYGGYNVGKTAIAFNLIAQTQRNGGSASFIDVEGTFDPSFAAQQGVELSQLALTDQYTLEQGNRVVDYIEMQLRSRAHDVIVLDSIAALLPKSEHESPMESASMGTAQARLMSAALRKLTAANKHTVMVYINQTREAVGASAFAKRSVTSGGKAMGFYAGSRLEIVRTENIKRKGRRVKVSTGEMETADLVKGHRLLIRVEKDKTGATFQSDQTTMVYDYDLGGFDNIEDLIYLGRQYGLIKKSGAKWWLADYQEDALQGRGKFKSYLRKNSLLAEELKEQIQEAAYSQEDAEIDDAAEDEDD